MPTGSVFTARDTVGTVHTFNLLPQVNSDSTVRRLDALSPIGYPHLLTGNGKTSKATATRKFAVDTFTAYGNIANTDALLGDYVYGLSMTLNAPRVGHSSAAVQSYFERLHLLLSQYMANVEFTSADIVTAGKVPWAMSNVPYLFSGLR